MQSVKEIIIVDDKSDRGEGLKLFFAKKYNNYSGAIFHKLISVSVTSFLQRLLFSDELAGRLDKELAAFPFVKLIRNTKREGLIR